MLDFVQHILVGISLIIVLALPVSLVLLYIRTHSKGLIIITVLVIFRSTFGLILGAVMKPFLDQGRKGEINNWLTQRMKTGDFVILYSYVTSIFYNGLLALGVSLIYQEWSCGNICWNHQKSSEVVNHA